MVISSCSKGKDDSVPIMPGYRTVSPYDYITSESLVHKLLETRKLVFSDPRASLGSKLTYAFELYFRRGNAYRHLRLMHYNEVRRIILGREVEWFFLSGGYGIIQ